MLKYLNKKLYTSIVQAKQLKLINKNKCIRRICCSRAISNLKPQKRLIHLSNTTTAKLFVDGENAYAYTILASFPLTLRPVTRIDCNKVIENESDFNSFLDQNWRQSTGSEITKAFLNVLDYCKENDVNLSDERFDKLVDGFLDNIEKLTSNEIYAILDCVIKLPQTPSHISHNFHDVWSALDDICVWRMKDWDVDTLFKFADLWYHTNLGRIIDYINQVVNKFSRKPERLSQKQLVHMFFYMNICRKKPIIFEYDAAVAKKVDTLTVNEMAVIAMAYFKCQTKVKIPLVLNRMIELVIENSTTIHVISLTAILKVLRYSPHLETANNCMLMLDKLVPEINRLSQTCLTHMALLGTAHQMLHEPILEAVAQKLVSNIDNVQLVRLKDIERMLLSTTMFNYNPKNTPDFYETLLKELHNKERLRERIQHPKCVPCALLFLSMRNLYSEELMNQVLDPEFTKEVYGKSSKQFPRELFSLDLSKEIDFPDYKGKQWTSSMRQRAAKWLVEYLPDETKKKLSYTEKFILDVIDTVHKITGDKNNSHIDYVLPHYSKPDMILCVDKKTNKFVQPTGFHNYFLGEIMRPYDLENFKWFSIVFVGYNNISRNTLKPLGNMVMKKRHLEAIGYKPVLVMANEFFQLRSEEKIDYILSRIKLL